nr:EndoU domain-containing protein [Marinobacter nanhaiticus]
MPSATGGHYKNPNLRILEELTPRNPAGVYEARVEVFDPKSQNWVPKLNPKGNSGKSTMFPDDWNEDRIVSEIQQAYQQAGAPPSGKWVGQSSSGLNIEGYADDSNRPFEIRTAWPVLE